MNICQSFFNWECLPSRGDFLIGDAVGGPHLQPISLGCVTPLGTENLLSLDILEVITRTLEAGWLLEGGFAADCPSVLSNIPSELRSREGHNRSLGLNHNQYHV